MDLVILKKRAEFQRVRGGQRWSGRGFLAEGKRRDATAGRGASPPDVTRFGFTVSKKVGNAVERNRIRRRIKEALRLLPAEIAPAGTDVVLVARRAALEMSFADLTGEVRAALIRLAPGGPQRDGKRKPQRPPALPAKR